MVWLELWAEWTEYAFECVCKHHRVAAAAAAAEAIALHYGLMHMIIPNSEEENDG